MNIKEIVQKLAQSNWKRDQWNIEYFDSVGFAEALIAELTKQNEPVAFKFEDGSVVDLHDMQFAIYKTGQKVWPLYTFPPTAEQIANETAEACARICDYKHNQPVELIEVAKTQSECAEAIRSGVWKEFK